MAKRENRLSATGGLNPFSEEGLTIDKVTTPTGADHAIKIHPIFERVLSKLEPVRQAMASVSDEAETRRLQYRFINQCRIDLSFLESHDTNLNPLYLATLLCEGRLDELIEYSPAVDAALEEVQEAEFRFLLKKSGLADTPELNAPWVEDTPERKRVANATRKWLDQFNPGVSRYNHYGEEWQHVTPASSKGLLMIGPCGAGKTKIASIMAVEVMRRGVQVKWYSCFGLVGAFRDIAARRGDITENEFVAELSAVPLLVIDDVGTGSLDNWSRPRIGEILDKRFTYGRSTLITSNLLPSDLVETVGARIASRLQLLPSLAPFPNEDFRARIARGAA